jgi:glycosyltransferase involved in cell wall biosynthesis
VPEDIANLPHPIFGFFGLIRDWIDLDLLAEVARRKPDWHFVLIGDSKVDLTPYKASPNMHFLGPKPYEVLPAYCKCFDAGLIPFKINDLTIAVNPIKLREYLSAGLPVISTPLPEVLVYKEMVHIVRTPEDFLAAAAEALAVNSAMRLKRQKAMAEETWPEKVGLICRCLSDARISEPHSRT